MVDYPTQFMQFWGIQKKPTTQVKPTAIIPKYRPDELKALQLATVRKHGIHVLTTATKAPSILAMARTIHELKTIQKDYGLTHAEIKEVGQPLIRPMMASHESMIRAQLGLRQREQTTIIDPLARGTREGAVAEGQLEHVTEKYITLVEQPPQQISFDWGLGGLGDMFKKAVPILIIGAAALVAIMILPKFKFGGEK